MKERIDLVLWRATELKCVVVCVLCVGLCLTD